MRKCFVCSVFLTIALLPGQSLYSRRQGLDRITSSAADIQDDVILRQTLYGTVKPEEITPAQGEAMVAAAERRVKRVQELIDQWKPLVEEGVLARNEMLPLTEELGFRQRALDLALLRAKFLREMAELAKAEQAFEPPEESLEPKPIKVRFDGQAAFGPAALRQVVLAFEHEFGKPLPISANGESAVHKALGYDHRGRVDVALSPDQPEGIWLRHSLEQAQIPYYAFRGPVAGKATASHIHIGPPSLRLRVAD